MAVAPYSPSVVCTKEGFVSENPCLSCLTKTELIAVIVAALAQLNGYNLTTGVNTLMDDASCVKCLNEKQLLQAIATVAVEKGMTPGTTIDQIRTKIKCLLCTDPKTLKSMVPYLLCKYWGTIVL